MADFAPPPGPPPPRVPEGWKAVWNDQYSEWFYVNTFTKESTWEKPTTAAHNPMEVQPPQGAPPTYRGTAPSAGEKINPNNPYNTSTTNPAQDIEADARYAAQLQAEEDARAGSHAAPVTGAGAEYYNPSNTGIPSGATTTHTTFPQDLPTRDSDKGSGSKGIMGKLMGKLSGSHSQHSSPQSHNQQGHPQPGYDQSYPPQQYGYGQSGGYGHGGMPPKRGMGGMGLAGAGALGLGGGLVGGMLLEHELSDNNQNGYQQGYENGQGQQDGMGNNDYGDGGMNGDYGNDDMMGGGSGDDF